MEFDALPDGRVCPACGAGKDQFVEVQDDMSVTDIR
ncbi:MAG: rubredoxin [Methanoregula sp.]